MKFAKELKRWRNFFKFTQQEAANRFFIPLDTWRNWEQGKNEPHPALMKHIESSTTAAINRKKSLMKREAV